LDTELSSTLVASVDGLEDLCLIGDLLKVRAVVDALLSRLAESAPEQEATMQLELAFLEIPVEPDEPSKGPGNRSIPGHRSPRWRFSHG